MQTTDAVLIADHEDDARAHLVDPIRRAGLQVVEARTGHEALNLARTLQISAMVLEIPLPGLSGYEVCRSVKAELGHNVPVVFVSGVRTESFDRVAGLMIGADDYMTKPVAADELLARLRVLSTRARSRMGSAPASLTRREREVLELMTEGLGPREIAEQLVISSSTVSTHVEHILRKLDVRSRAQAVALAFREGLVGGTRRPASAPGHDAAA